MFQTEQVTVKKGTRTLLNPVNISIQLGELTAVLGENGAGKSTLLRVLANEIQPTQGRVLLNGIPLHTLPSLVLARQRAVMPQSSTLDFGFLAEEVVAMGRTPFESLLSPAENRAITLQAMHITGVIQLRHRLYPTLSGGEKQRVQFARVLAQILDPRPYRERYLLLDEPFSNLDLRFQHELMQTVHRLSREGVGVWIILHDINLAACYADRFVLMKQGRILYEGTPNTVLQADTIEETFSYPVTIANHPSHHRPFIIPSLHRDSFFPFIPESIETHA